MSEVEALFEKAGRSLATAERLLGSGDTDFAASRAYYGYFYAAEALLLSKGVGFSRHGQVISQYGLHFAKRCWTAAFTVCSTRLSPCARR